MTESERESLYWRGAVGLLLLSPALGYWFGVHVTRLVYRQGPFLVFLLASLPAAFVIELLGCLIQRRKLSGRFWVDQPSATAQASVSGSVAEALAEVHRRLERLSFQVFAPEHGVLGFAKGQAAQVHDFLDHGFSGQVRVDPDAFGSRVQVSLTLQTQVLFETGEGERTRRLADYIALHSDVGSAPSVTLITYCGMVPAFASALLMAGVHAHPRLISAWVTSGSAAALGLLAFALFHTLRRRQRLFGLRLIVGGACLASVPLAVGAFRMMTSH